MSNNHIDLGVYSEVLSPYRRRIRESRSVEEASAYADDFLDRLNGSFGRDISRELFAEAKHLWAAFPPRAKTIDKHQELVEVLLGQAVDFYWYADSPRYRSDRDVEQDGTLVSFRRHHEDFEVKFIYVQYYGHLLMRIPNSLRLRYRRLANHPGKHSQGLTTTRCRKAVAGLINQISEDAAQRTRSEGPFRLLVNSVLRTVEYQNALANIGYVAPRHSGHLAGYAVDIEKQWYAENDRQAHAAIEDTLGQLFQGGVINLIEEGTHWHICLSPDHVQHYEKLAQKWERKG